MKNKECSIAGCHKKHYAKTFCQRHYWRFRQHGDPLKTKIRSRVEDSEESIRHAFNLKYRVIECGCWEWTGAKRKPFTKYLYETGEIKLPNGKRVKAHRLSYHLHKGPIPDGTHVLHNCHNPLCVNPNHLYLGNHQDNMRDMAAADRSGTKKLDISQVIEIFNSDLQTKTLCQKFSVERSTIKRIRNGKARRHITGL